MRAVDDRRNLHVRLTQQAWDGLVGFANDHDVSVTALLESAGRFLAAGAGTIEQVIELARAIDREHRSRRD